LIDWLLSGTARQTSIGFVGYFSDWQIPVGSNGQAAGFQFLFAWQKREEPS
jgi:hypothetical protein